MRKGVKREQVAPEPDAPQPLWRKVVIRVVRNLVIVACIYLVSKQFLVNDTSEEREARREVALNEGMRRAAEEASVEQILNDGCQARWRQGDDDRGRVLLSLAEVLNHQEMLKLSADQVASIEAARVPCEAACEAAREAGAGVVTDRAAASAHARRVIEALSVLDEDQLRLIDEWLGGDVLREAAGHE